MSLTEKKPYHVRHKGESWYLNNERETSEEELELWANDPACIERELCAVALANRRKLRQEREFAKDHAEEFAAQKIAERRQRLEASPFDPRSEVSADAKHIASRIVTHLWILFVLLPAVGLILLVMVGVIRI